MNSDAVDFDCIHGLSSFDKHYVRKPEDFASFAPALPHLSSVAEQLKRKSTNYNYSRESLARVIQDQYTTIDCINAETEERIAALKSIHTFTVITAHQPSLLTGPLYFIHKILSAIITAQKIQEELPEKRIIPLFIIGGEDHDFDEMNHLHYKNDRY